MLVNELMKVDPGIGFLDLKNQLTRFIHKRSEEALKAGDEIRDNISTKEELKKRRDFMHMKFTEFLGGIPASDNDLNSKTVKTIQCSGYRIENVIFESRPSVYVTSNLYVPDNISSPRGAVLFLCGHSDNGKVFDDFQIACQYLVRAGLVVLIQDPPGQGERLGYYEKSIGTTTVRCGTEEHSYSGTQCWPLGDGLARYFVHDAMRGIDYLSERPEVDSDKIGVTGASGGGTQTNLMMMCDYRIAAAAPSCFRSSRQIYLYRGQVQDCENQWPGISDYGFDHEDIMLNSVPKPVLILAATHDFFPIEGAYRLYEGTKRFWKMYDREQRFEFFEDDSKHRYTVNMARKAAEFFSLHLNGQKTVPGDDGIKPLDSHKLECTKSGCIKGEIKGARFIFDENLIRLQKIKNLRDCLPESERRERAFSWIREKVFYKRRPCRLFLRKYGLKQKRQYEEFKTEFYLWRSQEGIFNYGILLKNIEHLDHALPVTVAVWDGGTAGIQDHIKWIRKTCNLGRAVFVPDVSGTGKLRPNKLLTGPDPLGFNGVISKLAFDLIWLNDSLPAMRSYDVIRTLDVLESCEGIDTNDIDLYAYGKYGLYAQLSAFIDERVKNIEVTEGMGSYESWIRNRYYDSYDIMSVVIPGILKYCDLPDIEKWTKEKLVERNAK